MATLTQPRVSPTAADVKAAISPSSATTTAVTWTDPPAKKSRFLRRRRGSSNTVLTYTRSQSSLSMDSSIGSTVSVTASSKQKKKSLLRRLLSKSSPKKKLVIETTETATSAATAEDANVEVRHENDPEHEDTTEIDILEERGQVLQRAGQTEEALEAWEEALVLTNALSFNSVYKGNQIRCRMINLHMRIGRLEDANELIGQLQPLSSRDNSASCLEASPQLFNMLTSQNCWTFALQVSHQMPETDPLTLARLHLEVALQCDCPLSHLSDCYQLLLGIHDPIAYTLWQELAQVYGNLGEEELAMGCSQSRTQHLSSPQQVALAHYDQALNVYSPVGQYGLALKEAELALKALQRTNTTGTLENDDTTAAVKEEEDEAELLLTKLFQLKADVLCRMGRIRDSIQSYEELLQAYKNSSKFGPIDEANVLYILGKLSVRCRRFSDALDYFDQELQMTKSVVGNHHLAISKILHELARVADVGLTDYPLAVKYYEEALGVERGVYQQAKAQHQESGASQASSTLFHEARSQMGETKQCLGKLHFKMGDFATAVKTTLAIDK